MTKYRGPKNVPGQGPTFYHGTRVGFKKGGYLFPIADHHGVARAGVRVPEDDTYIYMTTDYELAVHYALNGVGTGRPKVLTIVPSGPVIPDASSYNGEWNQYRSQHSARVVDVQFVEQEQQ